jgi:hypothetical protein
VVVLYVRGEEDVNDDEDENWLDENEEEEVVYARGEDDVNDDEEES